MTKPFDATTKRLVELQPDAWARLALQMPADAPLPAVSVLNTDVSTVSAAVDHVLRVSGDEPFLVHLEMETRYHADSPRRYRFYNGQLAYQHGLDTRTCVLLLRRGADGPNLSGRLTRGSEAEQCLFDFQYRVVRVYAEDPAPLLAGPLVTLPLAPIAAVTKDDLPEVVRSVEDRLRAEAEPPLAADLLAATYVLLGLNHGRAFIERLMKGIRKMEDSDTYQAILERGEAKGRAEGEGAGRAEEARRLLLRIGEKRFGPADGATQTRVSAIRDVAELERLIDRALEVESWAELFAA